MAARAPIRVVVADDSALMRRMLSDLFSSSPDFQVVGVAHNGLDAVQKVKELRPDVVTMDLQMPHLDGYGAIKQIMAEAPTPILVLSALTVEGAEATVLALEAGAVDFLTKPGRDTDLDAWRAELLLKAKTAAFSRPARFSLARSSRPASPQAKRNQKARKAAELVLGEGPQGRRVLGIGASTGGPRALQELISALPGDLPVGVVVVQHMPAGFTRSMAERINSFSRLEVKEAEEGEKVAPGKVLIAPGDYHLRVNQREEVVLSKDAPIGALRPAVDVTFFALAEVYQSGTLGVVLTVMGSDGTKGAGAIKRAGGLVLVEDSSTCVVFGMPRSVIEEGYADLALPLPELAGAITRIVTRRP
ncbi:MAG: chemotaxis response regulator protein-glutamate methylesterase [Bacillota bacterium]|nr:chemotaxis response regulator protein-glutamate methylesterase [Bacillota bacterium]